METFWDPINKMYFRNTQVHVHVLPQSLLAVLSLGTLTTVDVVGDTIVATPSPHDLACSDLDLIDARYKPHFVHILLVT